MPKVFRFPPSWSGVSPGIWPPRSTILVLERARDSARVWRKEPCPSLVSTLRYPHRGNPSGKHPSAHRLAGIRAVTSSSSSPGHRPASPRGNKEMATGPNERPGLEGRLHTSAPAHVRATSLVSSEPQLPLLPAVRQKPAHPFPFPSQQVLPLIFHCQSQKPEVAYLVVGICLSLVSREKLYLLPCPLVLSSSLRNNFSLLYSLSTHLSLHPPPPHNAASLLSVSPAPLYEMGFKISEKDMGSGNVLLS